MKMYLVLFPEVGQAFKGQALRGWREGWEIVGLGVCVSRCLSRSLGMCGWTWAGREILMWDDSSGATSMLQVLSWS